jgi:hypothetical protein
MIFLILAFVGMLSGFVGLGLYLTIEDEKEYRNATEEKKEA